MAKYASLIIPRIILTEHLVWISKNEGIDAANDILNKVLHFSWNVIYETEELHKEAMAIGSRHGGLGAADLLLAAVAKQEQASVVISLSLSLKRIKIGGYAGKACAVILLDYEIKFVSAPL